MTTGRCCPRSEPSYCYRFRLATEVLEELVRTRSEEFDQVSNTGTPALLPN